MHALRALRQCCLTFPLRSVTIRSPYVADVQLQDGSVAMAHAPGMELGGVCVAGARVLLSRNAVGGATKTAFAIQLVASPEGCWIGAHPSLGNKLAAAALQRGLLAAALGPHVSARAEATHGRMRVDFELADAAGARTLLEVKNVVCSDYAKGSKAGRPKGYDLVYAAAEGEQYRRAAIFPVGKIGQKLEDGTRCVSERAIKHVSELAALTAESNGAVKARILTRAMPLMRQVADVLARFAFRAAQAAVLFVVNRGDCHSVSVRRSSCAALAAAAARAAAAGVAFHAFRVRWSGSQAHFDGSVPTDV